MDVQLVTVGTVPVRWQLPANYAYWINLGVKLLARSSNTGNIYLGFSNAVTTATGILVAKGTPGASFPTIVPVSQFSKPATPGGTPPSYDQPESPSVTYPQGGTDDVWLVADAPGQLFEVQAA
jgi:hypothetical protein